MKKYLLYLLMAFAAISFTACEDDAEPMGSSIRADVPSLNFEGQTAPPLTVSILSDGDWVATAPEWITVTPNYGTGNTTVTIAVADNMDTDGTLAAERTGTVTFSVMEAYAIVDIIQAGDPAKKPVEPAKITIAEFNAAAEDATVFYELTGTISAVKSTYYGNFNITDATGTVYVYGLYEKMGGEYGAFENLELSEGDLITLRGTRGSYNGLIEVMNGYYVSHVASLVSATPSEVELPIEGGEFEIALAYKGESFEVAIDDAAKAWLNMGTIKPDGDTTRISFSAGANEGGLRNATISFTSSKGGVVSTVTTAVTQEGSIVDISIADFLTKEDGPALYRLAGKIKSISSATYGNIYLEDATGDVYVYGVTATAVDKNDKSFESLGLKVGDVLTIVGTKSSYNGSPQVGYNSVPAYYVSHTSYTESSITDFLAASTGDAWYKLTGTVANIKNTQYGNFDIVDESGASVYVYGLTKAPVANNDKSFAALEVKEGDKLTLIGKRAEYNGTPQVGGPAYYISHETGQTGGDEGGEGGGETTTGSEISWASVGAANQSWAVETHATYGSGYAATHKGIKVSYYQYGNNNPARTPDADHIRVYKGSAFVISSTNGKAITKVVIETTDANYTFDIKVGDSVVSPNGTTITWTGSANPFEAIMDAGQVRIKSLLVTLAE